MRLDSNKYYPVAQDATAIQVTSWSIRFSGNSDILGGLRREWLNPINLYPTDEAPSIYPVKAGPALSRGRYFMLMLGTSGLVEPLEA